MRLRWLAAICVGVMIVVNIAVLASGNMHSGRHHPTWVNALSWLFTAALVALIVIGVVALRRRRRSRSLRGHS